jgi:hypothetical protein
LTQITIEGGALVELTAWGLPSGKLGSLRRWRRRIPATGARGSRADRDRSHALCRRRR